MNEVTHILSGIEAGDPHAAEQLLPLVSDELGKLDRWLPMVRKAVSFILRNGPVTQQDRWEEDAGYSPFTLAAEISALLAAADIARERQNAARPWIRAELPCRRLRLR